MSSIRDSVHAFLLKNFYVGNEGLTDGESTGILEVIAYLEETFGLRVEDSEILPENLDSVGAIVRFVEKKKA